MKTILLALLGLGAITASLPAAAGPDWTVIERARAAARAGHAAHCAQPADPPTPATAR
ncbi:hypothetical protein [Cupriavidus necator]|uniref:hypothetical protein n=1 Tax=Cupriavidus necator TaxID=106590 RepID=UPI000AD2D27E|nr:hypothetical protein [Cupriavidus necator]